MSGKKTAKFGKKTAKFGEKIVDSSIVTSKFEHPSLKIPFESEADPGQI